MNQLAIPVFDGVFASLGAKDFDDTRIGAAVEAHYSSKPKFSASTFCFSRERRVQFRTALAMESAEDYLHMLGNAWAITCEMNVSINSLARAKCLHASMSREKKLEIGLRRYLVLLNDDLSVSAESSTNNNVELQAELTVASIKNQLSVSRRNALDYMYEVIEDAYSLNDITLINEMLFAASKHLIDGSLAVSFLRATFRVKGRTEYWSYYYGIVRRSLEGNPGAERLLRGLGV